MRNGSDKRCRENQNTHFVFSNFIKNRTVYDTSLKNSAVEPGIPQMTIWRMRIACWIPKGTHIHTLELTICNRG